MRRQRLSYSAPGAGLIVGLCLTASSALAVRVSIPDYVRVNQVGDTVLVPFLVSGHGGQGIVAVDMAIEFSQDTITGTRRFLYGNAAPRDSNWYILTNAFPCSLLIAMANTTPLIAEADTWDTLLHVKLVANVLRPGPVFARFTRCRMNEGQVPCTTGYYTGLHGNGPEGARRRQVSVFPSPASAVVRVDAEVPTVLVSASGREVLALRQGLNDVSRLAPGVYFVREASGVEREASRVTKIVVTR